MPKTTLVTLNGNAGAFTSINSTIPARRVEIVEDQSVSPQGLIYQLPDDNFTNSYQVAVPGSPDAPQIILGNKESQGRGQGPILGLPQQTPGGQTIPATTYIKVKSAGVGGGNKIRVTEYD